MDLLYKNGNTVPPAWRATVVNLLTERSDVSCSLIRYRGRDETAPGVRGLHVLAFRSTRTDKPHTLNPLKWYQIARSWRGLKDFKLYVRYFTTKSSLSSTPEELAMFTVRSTCKHFPFRCTSKQTHKQNLPAEFTRKIHEQHLQIDPCPLNKDVWWITW